MLGMAIGGILGGLSAAAKVGVGLYQNHLANKINPIYTPYQTSEYAKRRLGLAGQLFNGRMKGAASEERNIMASGANSISNINRNATDSSQALALAAGVQGQENNAFGQLGIKEQQNQYNLLDNLNDAYGGMTAEGDKIYQDKLQKYGMDTQEKAALRGAGFSNIFSGANDAASLATQYSQLGKKGMMGGFQTSGGYYGD